MAGLTPEEQHFFDNGGDTSRLQPAPGTQGVDPLAPNNTPVDNNFRPIDLAGLGNIDPPAPVVVPPVVAPVVVPVVPDQTEFLRRSLAEAQQTAANLAAQLEAARTPAPPPPVVAPDPETDPLGSMMHQLAEVNKTVAALQADLAGQSNQNAQMAAFNNFRTQVVGLREQFKTVTPDFDAAYAHLRDSRIADLRTFGIVEADVAKQIFQEEVVLSEAAIKQGKNPAEAIYEMAKRHGYAAKAPAPPAPNAPAPAANKLATIQAGVAATQPSSLPAKPGTEDITIEALKDASDSDLNKLVTDPNSWAKIAGGNNIPL